MDEFIHYKSTPTISRMFGVVIRSVVGKVTPMLGTFFVLLVSIKQILIKMGFYSQTWKKIIHEIFCKHLIFTK
jgi:hypothetical protein